MCNQGMPNIDLEADGLGGKSSTYGRNKIEQAEVEESFFEQPQKEYKFIPGVDPDDRPWVEYCLVPDSEAQERRYIASNLNKVT